MIQVHIYPEVAVKGQNVKDALVISIVSPGREHPKIEGSNIYRFHFHDVTCRYDLPDGRIILPMEESIAESIVDIAMKNRTTNRWIIHCEAGISRSPAVAIGISKYIKLTPNRRMLKKMYPLHNKYVTRLIEEAMDRKIGDPSMILKEE
jgi:predicted protein tyrosine phosphatase